MSLARLWRDQGKRTEARDLLTPVYDWFTEGFAFGIGLHQMMNQRAGMTGCARQSRQATVSGTL